MTVKNKYPLPLISELINKLRGAKYVTKLDVRWGFNNVRMKEEDEWKAAFRTNWWLFELPVMFFRLCNNPATFQTMMDDIFDDLITGGVVVVYLDDIIIFMETLEEHQKVTRRVMELLWKHNLFLKPEKCEFEKTEVEYLGVIISQNSVKMDPVKVAGVMEWPTLSNRKEVQSFLGFTNFYCRFIQGFSHLVCPLFNLTQKDTEWRWGTEEQSAFDSLKGGITTAPILTLPDNSWPFWIKVNSSYFANRHNIVSTITRRQQMASRSIPFQIPLSGRVELQNPWQGDVGNCESVGGVEAFCGRCGALLWDLDRPQEPSVFYDGQEA